MYQILSWIYFIWDGTLTWCITALWLAILTIGNALKCTSTGSTGCYMHNPISLPIAMYILAVTIIVEQIRPGLCIMLEIHITDTIPGQLEKKPHLKYVADMLSWK